MGEDSALIDGVNVEQTEVFDVPLVSPALSSVSTESVCTATTSDRLSPEDISPALMPLDVVVVEGMLDPKDVLSNAHVPAVLSKELQPPSRNKRGIKKMGSRSLQDEFFCSEVERNNSAIQKDKSDIEKNNSDIKKNDSVIELNNLTAQVLKRLLQKDSQASHDSLSRFTYVLCIK